MHVVIIPSWYPSPENPIQGIFFRDQAHSLKKAEHQVGIIAPQHRSLRLLKQKALGWSRGVKIEEDAGIPVYQYYSWALFPRVPYANQHLWVRAGESLFERYIREHGKPDIIHAHSVLNAGLLVARLKDRFRIPAVLTEHSSAFARKMVRGWQEKGVRAALAAMDARLCVSVELGRLLEAKYDENARPWIWLPNMVDTQFFYPDLSQREQGSSSRPFTFLTVSVLSENKGHRFLLEAFAQQFSGDTGMRLRIGGGGILRSRLEQRARELRISEQVTFLGPLNRARVRAEMQACNSFVLPSLYETFGVVIIEALACGKPVIATRCGGPESIVDASNGMLVPVQDKEALGDAMARMRLIASDFDQQKIRADCVARFSEYAVAGALSSVYEDILSERHER